MIHHLNRCIVINISFILTLCHAMETTKNFTFTHPQASIILSTLTTQEFPRSMQCLHNNIVAIVKKNQCNIYNYSTNSKINTFGYDTKIIHTAVHPHKKLLAICSKKENTTKIQLYDITTNQIIWKHTATNCCSESFFSQINNDAIFLSTQQAFAVHSFNYKNNCRKSYPLLAHTSAATIKCLITNPTRPEFILFTNNTDDIKILYYNKTVNSIITKQTYSTADWKSGEITDGCYSPDGSILAYNHAHLGISTIDLQENLRDKLIDYQNKRTKFCGMKFHPKSFILAVFSIPSALQSYPMKAFISYFNTKQQRILARTDLAICIDDIGPYMYTLDPNQCIDFTPDGTQLIVALYKKCLVLKVPFNALYLPGTRNKCIRVLWTLRNCFDNNNTPLPQDIKNILIQYLLGACKYSLTNH